MNYKILDFLYAQFGLHTVFSTKLKKTADNLFAGSCNKIKK
jgi:hypothetical protein